MWQRAAVGRQAEKGESWSSWDVKWEDHKLLRSCLGQRSSLAIVRISGDKLRSLRWGRLAGWDCGDVAEWGLAVDVV
jgi:hypothetical protein